MNRDMVHKLAEMWISRDETVAVGVLGDWARTEKLSATEFLSLSLQIVLPHTSNDRNSIRQILLMALQLRYTWDEILSAISPLAEENVYLKNFSGSIAMTLSELSSEHKALKLLLDTKLSGLIKKEYKKTAFSQTTPTVSLGACEQGKVVLVLTVLAEELSSVCTIFRKHCQDTNGSFEHIVDKEHYAGQFLINNEPVRVVIGQFRGTGNEMSGVDASHFINKCQQLYSVKPFYAMLSRNA